MSRGNVAAAPAIREHPIIFSAPMVRAILDGTKTQTRRVVTRANSLVDGRAASADLWASLDFSAAWVDRGPSPAGNPGPYLKVPKPDDESVHRVYPRVMLGDRLWVRETWQHLEGCVGEETVYRATDAGPTGESAAGLGWRPSIHMPRWASRITLEITGVRVELLQDISEEDAVAEGVEPLHQGYFPYGITTFVTTVQNGREVPAQCCRTARWSYEMLWDSINAKRAPWESNPWVWVRSFPSLGGAA